MLLVRIKGILELMLINMWEDQHLVMLVTITGEMAVERKSQARLQMHLRNISMISMISLTLAMEDLDTNLQQQPNRMSLSIKLLDNNNNLEVQLQESKDHNQVSPVQAVMSLIYRTQDKTVLLQVNRREVAL